MKECTLFFDLGSTLLQPAGISARRRLGQLLSLSEKEVKRAGRLIMTSPSESLESLAGGLSRVLAARDPRDVLDAVRLVWREQFDRVALHPHAPDLVERLGKSTCRLGLLSNVWPPVIEGIDARYPGFLSSFEHRVLSCRLGFKKPSPAIFEAAIAAAGVPPHRTWMIGDSYELDVEPAMKAGMHAVWVLSRPEAERELLAQVLTKEKPRPDSAVADLTGLPAVLDRLAH
ncbi:MAG: HAD family hydrolase [Syntrophobacteraceae bacterium]|jgi:HAD superfamily hydrolase (TIGR01509 family)|nr:HAD family hydrolase [Syntrophobacteraceae bacterium]